MLRRSSILLPTALALVLSACGAQQVAVPAEIAAQAPSEYVRADVLVDTDWILANASDPNVRIIDVSKAESYQQGHLPGAVSAPSRTAFVNPDDPTEGQIATPEQFGSVLSALGVENDDTIILYDDTRNLDASRTYWAFKYYQHEDVRIYNGGSPRWTADGQSLVNDAPSVTASTYVVAEPDPAIRTDWNYVISKLEDPNAVFCDSRSLAEYSGVDVRAERGGHIPDAVNIEWTQAINADGTFRSAPELWKLYTEAGFTPDKEIITYCQTGVRSAHTWFVLTELLGYEQVRNYDGSWTEYGNRPESVIE